MNRKEIKMEKSGMRRLRILPQTNFFIYAILEVAAHFVIPMAQIVRGPVRWIGIIFIGVGAYLVISANRLFKKFSTTVKLDESPSFLVREGPYRVSRNPMYLGMFLALIGEAILLGSVSPFLGPFTFFLMVDTLHVALEERTLTDVFGEEYSAYRRRVRRWL